MFHLGKVCDTTTAIFAKVGWDTRVTVAPRFHFYEMGKIIRLLFLFVELIYHPQTLTEGLKISRVLYRDNRSVWCSEGGNFMSYLILITLSILRSTKLETTDINKSSNFTTPSLFVVPLEQRVYKRTYSTNRVLKMKFSPLTLYGHIFIR